MAQFDVYAVGATRIVVGLSAIVKLQAAAYENGDSIKILAGSGTLEIIPPPLALSGTSATGWGLGYPVGASESVNIGGPAIFYLAATGATMTAAMYFGYTQGVSLAI